MSSVINSEVGQNKSAVVFEDSDGEKVGNTVELSREERLAIVEREAGLLRDELLREASENSGIEAKISRNVTSEDESKIKKDLLPASAEKRKRVKSGDQLSAKKSALESSDPIVKINTTGSALPPPPALTINTSCTVEKYAAVQANLINIFKKSGCEVYLDVNVQPGNGKLHTIKLTGQAGQIAAAQKMISEVVRAEVVKVPKPVQVVKEAEVEEPEVDDGLPPITINMPCPQDKVRLVIGKQGVTIKDMSKKTNCTIDVMDGVRGGMQEIAVTGKPQALSKAIALITAIIGTVERSAVRNGDDNRGRERSRDRGRGTSPDRDRRGSRGNGRDSRAHRDRDNFGEVRESFRGHSTSRERALREGRAEAVGSGDNFGRDRDIQQQPVVRSEEAIAQLQREHEIFQQEQRHRQEQFNQQQQQRFGGQHQDYNHYQQFPQNNYQQNPHQQQQGFQQQPVQQQAQMQPQGQQQPLGFTPFPIQMASAEQLQALYQQVQAQAAAPFNPWETYVDAGLVATSTTASVAPVAAVPRQQQVQGEKSDKAVGEKHHHHRHKGHSAAAQQEQREAVNAVQKQHEQQQPVQQQQFVQQVPQQAQFQYAHGAVVNSFPVAAVAPQHQQVVGQLSAYQQAATNPVQQQQQAQPVHQTWQPTKEQAEKMLGQPLSSVGQVVAPQQTAYQQPQSVQQGANYAPQNAITPATQSQQHMQYGNYQTTPIASVAPQQQQYGQYQTAAPVASTTLQQQQQFGQYPGYQQPVASATQPTSQPAYGQQQQQQQANNQWSSQGAAPQTQHQLGTNAKSAPAHQKAVSQSQPVAQYNQQLEVAYRAPVASGAYPQQQMYGQQAQFAPQTQQQQPVYGAPQQQGGYQTQTGKTSAVAGGGGKFGLGQQAIQMAQQQQQYGQQQQPQYQHPFGQQTPIQQQAPSQNPYLQHQVQTQQQQQQQQQRNPVAGPAENPRGQAHHQQNNKRY